MASIHLELDGLLVKASQNKLIGNDKWRLIEIINLLGPPKPVEGRQAVLCAFHKEETPSMILDAKTKEFRCLSCGECGKLVTYEQMIKDNEKGEDSRLNMVCVYEELKETIATLEKRGHVTGIVAVSLEKILSDIKWYLDEHVYSGPDENNTI